MKGNDGDDVYYVDDKRDRVSEYAEFQYKTSDYYDPKHERVLLWNCPKINIKWPIKDPELNQRDLKGLPLEKCEIFK